MENLLIKLTPFLWWLMTIVLVFIAWDAISEFLSELPIILAIIIGYLYSFLSVMMGLRITHKNEKERSTFIKYTPSAEITPIILSGTHEVFYIEDFDKRDRLLSQKIDEAIKFDEEVSKAYKRTVE